METAATGVAANAAECGSVWGNFGCSLNPCRSRRRCRSVRSVTAVVLQHTIGRTECAVCAACFCVCEFEECAFDETKLQIASTLGDGWYVGVWFACVIEQTE